MWENRSLVLEKVQEIERAQDNIDKINQVTQYFAPQEVSLSTFYICCMALFFVFHVAGQGRRGRLEANHLLSRERR